MRISQVKTPKTAESLLISLKEEVEIYCRCIFEPKDIVEIRLLAKNRPTLKYWKRAEQLPELLDTLNRKNEQGYNVYAGANPRTAKNLSGDDNIKLARCLFVDFDHIDPGDGCGRFEFCATAIEEAGLPWPTLSICSGHGVHCYWRLSEPLKDLKRWRQTQQGLIDTLNSDPVIKNPERIMRLPGFINHKPPKAETYIINKDVT
jgi:hypothetical protein